MNDLVTLSHPAPSPAHHGIVVPALFADLGPQAQERFLEFFAGQIRNRHTRRAYMNAIRPFFDWCAEGGVSLAGLSPLLCSAYVEKLGRELATASVKQHLAALRMLFDWLVTGQVVPFNPFASVRGPRHVVRKGKTPVLFEDDAKQLMTSFDTETVVGLRDRALVGVMIYSFARVGAVTGMKVEDYYVQGRRAWFRLHEKGGQFHRVPAHHKAAEYIEAYIEAAGIAGEKGKPLFRSARGRSNKLTNRPLLPRNVLHMVKRRCLAAGLPIEICDHSFRATGITNYLANDGTLEVAAQIAGHASTRTTQLYNRTSEEVNLAEIERVRI